MNDLPAGHDIGIHIGRVSGFHDQGAVLPVEQIQKVAQLVAGAAGNENLVRRKHDAAPAVMLRNGFPEEGSSAFRHIAMEAALPGLILHRPVKRLNDGGNEGQGNIADTHAVQMRAGMGGQIGFRLLCDMMEQIRLLQVRVAEVRRQHGITSKKKGKGIRQDSLALMGGMVTPGPGLVKNRRGETGEGEQREYNPPT